MRIVTAQELNCWLATGKVLEQDGRGPKVVHLSDGQLLKIFRPRRRLWLGRLRPQAQNFATNAARLQERQISTPTIGECFWLDRSQAISACLYVPLAGTSLDRIFHQHRSDFDALLPQLAAFIRQLHQRGIYFRSLHLGNILLLPQGGFGLIDFLDLRLKRGPLGSRLIARNLEHLHRYLLRSQIKDFPWQELLRLYRK